jgi:hypothetical protein
MTIGVCGGVMNIVDLNEGQVDEIETRLDMFDWQGKDFYEALGYKCVGQYDNTEDGYSEYFFLKRIA